MLFRSPIYGDVTAAFEAAGLGTCIDYVDAAASAYLMDPSGALATWGNFLTANAALFSGTYTACEGADGLWNMLYGGCLAGGGDTSRFLIEEGVADMFDFISTGGGAMLDFLANKELPGLEALKK